VRNDQKLPTLKPVSISNVSAFLTDTLNTSTTRKKGKEIKDHPDYGFYEY